MYIYLLVMIKFRTLIIIGFFALQCINPSLAQYDNTPFLHHLPQDSSKINSLYLSFETLNFLKNNEYSSYIADGYTLFGSQFLPYFSYFAASKVRVNAGIYLQKDFGNDKFTAIEPYFSIKLSRKNFHLIFGNLEGSLNHKLIEPLYDFERVLNDRQEFGFQAMVDREKFFGEVWVNWENMIYKGDPVQEEITGGLSIDKKFNLGKLEISIPLQLFIYHRGGQIDSNPNHLLTRVNATAGVNLNLPLGNFIESINGSAYYINSINGDSKTSNDQRQPPAGPVFPSLPQYPEASKGDTLVYGEGNGFYANAGLNLKHNLNLMASFWIADNFASPKGGQLYPSETSSYKKAGLIVSRRTLIIARIFHDWYLMDNVIFTTRVEPYWDLNTNAFEFAFGFYLNYRPEFLLWRNK